MKIFYSLFASNTKNNEKYFQSQEHTCALVGTA